MNARWTVLTAMLIGATACATAPTRPPGPPERVRFNGYRLEVTRDATGKPISAKAFKEDTNSEVAAAIVPLGDVNVCVPKRPGAEVATKYCEPLSIFPDEVNFKSGDKSICYYVSHGQVIYYSC